MIAITKTRSILHRVDLHGVEGDTFVTFEREVDEPDERQRQVKLDRHDWADLGEPNVITVTIRPGDRLN